VQTETSGRQIPWEESALTDVYYFTPTAPGMAAPLLPTYRDGAPPERRSKSTASSSGKTANKKSRQQARRSSGPPPGLGVGVGAGL
jgi:hypothetical protein